MEHKFDIKQMEYKTVAKKQETTIIKICKKKKVVDEVFPEEGVENIYEPGPLIIDRLDDKIIDRTNVLKRLSKLMNGEEVQEFKEILNKNAVAEEEEAEAEEVVKKALVKEKEAAKEKVVAKEKKPRLTKKPEIQDTKNTIAFSNDLYQEITKTQKPVIHRVSSYYMTNRLLFIQKLGEMFETHKQKLSKIVDADVSCEKRSTEEFETLVHQDVVRDYLNLYSPYRGLLIYHGLGSGKTCTSIAVAEGMKSEKQIVVLTPASLKSNFFSELKKCGDDIYRKKQFWVKTKITDKRDAIKIKKVIGLDEDYIMDKGVWLGKKTAGTTGGQKFEDLSPVEQNEVDAQLDLMIRKKYKDINYNGLNGRIMDELTDNNKKNPFDNKVVIIDEAHNFVSRIVNKLKQPKTISYRLYDYLMSAQNVKIVFLTGTPIINYPNEIAILFNMLRGYIKTWTFTIKQNTKQKVDKDAILNFFKKAGFNIYDYVEYGGNKVTVTRNPFGFVNVSKKTTDEYNGVKMDETGNLSDFEFKKRVTEILEANDLEVQKVDYDPIKALPDNAEKFIEKFIDPETGNMMNADLFKRRILGLTSYFKSAQEKLLPKYEKKDDFQIIRVTMSDHQMAQYSLARIKERKESKNSKIQNFGNDLFNTTSTYRIYSREICNFVFPDSYPRPEKVIQKEEGEEEAEVEAEAEEDEAEKKKKKRRNERQISKGY